MIFDAHSDYGIKIYYDYQSGKETQLSEQYYQFLRKSNVKIEVMMAGGDFSLGGINFSDKNVILNTIAAVEAAIDRSEGKYKLIKDKNDFDKIYQSEQIGIILGLEGVSVLGEGSVSLEDLYDKGIRSLVLTDNQGNVFAGGCANKDMGLTLKGKELLQEIAQYPFALDLAHISEKAYFDCLNCYNKTILVSHGNLQRYACHFRNLTDIQLKELFDRGGVLGLSMISLFIDNNKYERTKLANIIEQILYLINTYGINCVGFGADFMDYIEDIVIPYFDENNYPPTIYTYPEKINNIGDLYLVEAELRKSFSKKEVEQVSFYNMERIFKEVFI